MERKYSVGEIDRMRTALQWMLIPPMVAYNPTEKAKEIEECLRTYMLNGTNPEELETSAALVLRAQQQP